MINVIETDACKVEITSTNSRPLPGIEVLRIEILQKNNDRWNDMYGTRIILKEKNQPTISFTLDEVMLWAKRCGELTWKRTLANALENIRETNEQGKIHD